MSVLVIVIKKDKFSFSLDCRVQNKVKTVKPKVTRSMGDFVKSTLARKDDRRGYSPFATQTLSVGIDMKLLTRKI